MDAIAQTPHPQRVKKVSDRTSVNSALIGSTDSKGLAEVSCWPLQHRRDVDAETVSLISPLTKSLGADSI